jgi:nicotinamide-nucleotide amidase
VFGVDDETMEIVVSRLLVSAGLTLGLAESVTGGLVGARLTAVPGASDWFRGSVVSYATAVKQSVLGVPPGPVVSEAAAVAMAIGAARVLDADVGLAVTGVAGPDQQEGMAVGTVFFGLALDGKTEATSVMLPGDRDRVRQFAAISLLDLLRRRLIERGR